MSAPLLQHAVRSHWRRLIQSAGVNVTAVRGAQEIEIRAVPAGSDIATEQDGVSRTTSKTKDFLVLNTSIVFGGKVSLPKQGDRILWSGRIFEAIPVNDGRCYDFEDGSYDEVIRIFTREINR